MTDRERLAALVAQPRVPLGEACLVIGRHLGEPTTVAEGLAMLDALAGGVEPAGAAATLDDVAHHLFGRVGLRGDAARYYEPACSMLPQVIDRRRGIPISLSIVVIEVAARCGVAAEGVGMPGHFLVGDGPSPTRWLDAFAGGTWLDRAGAQSAFRRVHGDEATFDPAFLAPTAGPQIVARVLANLAGAYGRRGDPNRRLRALELRSDLPVIGDLPRNRAELASALVATGRVDEGRRELEALLARVDPRRRPALEAEVARLRARLS